MRFEIPVRNLRWPESEALGERLLALARDHESKKVIVDFGHVEFVSGAALGKLVAVREALRSQGKKMVFRNVRPHVYEVLRVTGLAKLFEVRASGVGGLLPCL